MAIIVRAYQGKESDLAFIRNTWLLSFRLSHFAGTLPDDLYLPAQTEQIGRLLGISQTLIACDLEDQDTILGYLTHQDQVIHYIYVKEDWRGIGVARGLYKSAGLEGKSVSYTHKTPDCANYLRQHSSIKATFNPAAARIATVKRKNT